MGGKNEINFKTRFEEHKPKGSVLGSNNLDRLRAAYLARVARRKRDKDLKK